MNIPISRYVDITSAVGAGVSVATRDLIGRLYTTNELVPTGSVVEFTDAASVGTYFGTSSEEYARAVFYFGWISKNVTKADKISFARWADTAVGSQIFGKSATYSLATLQAITNGDFTLTLGGSTSHLTGIDLSGAADLAGVATLVQAAINGYSAGGGAWTGATVSYDSTRASFNMTSGATGADTVSVTAGTTTDVASAIGWLTGAILSDGAAQQSITTLLDDSTNTNNNFGTFAFIPTLTQAEIVEAATWNQTQNNLYMYSVRTLAACASDLSTALIDLGGTTLTLAPLAAEYPEQAPMMIEAATNYNGINSVQNYMFQQFDLTASVDNTTDADTYDALRVNYYGQTQTAGTEIKFYQRGLMMGGSSDPIDQNTYANEQWLKDAFTSSIMTLLLAQSKVSANTAGRAQVLATLQSTINQALQNGTISVGKTLTAEQKIYITNATNDSNAWYQVQNQGYWLDVQIETYTADGTTRYKAVYTLLYSKDDVIRKVEGSDILI